MLNFYNQRKILLSNCFISAVFQVFVIGYFSSTISVEAYEVDRLYVAKEAISSIEIWEKQAARFKEKKELDREAEIIYKISQVHNRSGNFELALRKLNYIISLNIKNLELKSKVLEEKGNSLHGKGEYLQAISAYQKSLKIDNSLSCLNNLVKTWILLVNKTSTEIEDLKEKESLELFNALDIENSSLDNADSSLIIKLEDKKNLYWELALKKAKQAKLMDEGKNSLSEVYALINWNTLISMKENTSFSSSISKVDLIRSGRILASEIPSRALVFSLINWSKVDKKNSFHWLNKSLEAATLTQDSVAISHANLELGKYYYYAKELKQSLKYVRQSQWISQSNFIHENLYKGSWLAGKIYLELGKYKESLTAYQNAVAALELVYQDTSLWDSSKRADHRSNIKPLYHELLELLLDKQHIKNRDIEQAIFIADKLRFTELQNYFGDNCFEVRSLNSPDAVQTDDKSEALLYSLVLKEKTYVILRLPNGSYHLNKVNISKSQIEHLAILWRSNLTAGNTNKFQLQGRKLYKLLIEPFEQKLNRANLQVLVFVHDGILRNLPMAALYDGDQYLAQKWASVSSLGLNIAAEADLRVNKETVIFGLSRPDQPGWADLEMVAEEIRIVQDLIGGKKYLDSEFTVENLTKRLDNKIYSVVHLATHGYFAGNVEDSFLLSYDSQISIADLENILQNQTIIELLVLSACETAITSENSLLGLAGVAARNGVKSVLGSLWLVQDDLQSKVMGDFYTYLASSENNRAIALQKVQQDMISKYTHPQYWASLNLIGDYR